MLTKCLYIVCVWILTLGLSACENKTAVKDFEGSEEEERADVKRGVKPIPDDQVAVIETADYGLIVIELYSNIAPQTVDRFKKLIQEGFYNGTTFHRVNPDLIQGGDPLTKDYNPQNDGMGNSPYPNLPAEFSDVPYELGSVGAARRGASPAFGGLPAITEEQARNTANCQFFITLGEASQFDEEYTLFGKVINGINNARIIAGVPVSEGSDRPEESVVIKAITLEERSRYVGK